MGRKRRKALGSVDGNQPSRPVNVNDPLNFDESEFDFISRRFQDGQIVYSDTKTPLISNCTLQKPEADCNGNGGDARKRQKRNETTAAASHSTHATQGAGPFKQASRTEQQRALAAKRAKHESKEYQELRKQKWKQNIVKNNERQLETILEASVESRDDSLSTTKSPASQSSPSERSEKSQSSSSDMDISPEDKLVQTPTAKETHASTTPKFTIFDESKNNDHQTPTGQESPKKDKKLQEGNQVMMQKTPFRETVNGTPARARLVVNHSKIDSPFTRANLASQRRNPFSPQSLAFMMNVASTHAAREKPEKSPMVPVRRNQKLAGRQAESTDTLVYEKKKPSKSPPFVQPKPALRIDSARLDDDTVPDNPEGLAAVLRKPSKDETEPSPFLGMTVELKKNEDDDDVDSLVSDLSESWATQMTTSIETTRSDRTRRPRQKVGTRKRSASKSETSKRRESSVQSSSVPSLETASYAKTMDQALATSRNQEQSEAADRFFAVNMKGRASPFTGQETSQIFRRVQSLFEQAPQESKGTRHDRLSTETMAREQDRVDQVTTSAPYAHPHHTVDETRAPRNEKLPQFGPTSIEQPKHQTAETSEKQIRIEATSIRPPKQLSSHGARSTGQTEESRPSAGVPRTKQVRNEVEALVKQRIVEKAANETMQRETAKDKSSNAVHASTKNAHHAGGKVQKKSSPESRPPPSASTKRDQDRTSSMQSPLAWSASTRNDTNAATEAYQRPEETSRNGPEATAKVAKMKQDASRYRQAKAVPDTPVNSPIEQQGYLPRVETMQAIHQHRHRRPSQVGTESQSNESEGDTESRTMDKRLHKKTQPSDMHREEPDTSSPKYDDSASESSGASSGMWTADHSSWSQNTLPIFQLQNGERFVHPPLPPGWSMGISRSKQIPFYFHPDFGRSFYPPILMPSKDGTIKWVKQYVNFSDDERSSSSSSSSSQVSGEESIESKHSSRDGGHVSQADSSEGEPASPATQAQLYHLEIDSTQDGYVTPALRQGTDRWESRQSDHIHSDLSESEHTNITTPYAASTPAAEGDFAKSETCKALMHASSVDRSEVRPVAMNSSTPRGPPSHPEESHPEHPSSAESSSEDDVDLQDEDGTEMRGSVDENRDNDRDGELVLLQSLHNDEEALHAKRFDGSPNATEEFESPDPDQLPENEASPAIPLRSPKSPGNDEQHFFFGEPAAGDSDKENLNGSVLESKRDYEEDDSFPANKDDISEDSSASSPRASLPRDDLQALFEKESSFQIQKMVPVAGDWEDHVSVLGQDGASSLQSNDSSHENNSQQDSQVTETRSALLRRIDGRHWMGYRVRFPPLPLCALQNLGILPLWKGKKTKMVVVKRKYRKKAPRASLSKPGRPSSTRKKS